MNATAAGESRCSACGTAVPAGASRCPGCGRMQGNLPRCPSCNAQAALRAVPGGFVCAACNAPRRPDASIPVEAGSSLFTGSPVTKQGVTSFAMGGGAIGLKLVGLVSMAGGTAVGGILAAIGGLPEAAVPAAVTALAGIGLGGFLFQWGSSVSRRAREVADSGDELRILALASSLGGELYVTDVARGLGISVAEAERKLSALADGTRVVAELSPEGLIRFEFRELARRGPRVAARVADPAEDLGHDVAAASETRDREHRR